LCSRLQVGELDTPGGTEKFDVRLKRLGGHVGVEKCLGVRVRGQSLDLADEKLLASEIHHGAGTASLLQKDYTITGIN
jgi:hypothetical protein